MYQSFCLSCHLVRPHAFLPHTWALLGEPAPNRAMVCFLEGNGPSQQLTPPLSEVFQKTFWQQPVSVSKEYSREIYGLEYRMFIECSLNLTFPGSMKLLVSTDIHPFILSDRIPWKFNGDPARPGPWRRSQRASGCQWLRGWARRTPPVS